MDFKISYEDAKKILSVFENSVYRQVIGYIEILHSLKEEGTDLTLKEKIDLEIALLNKEAIKNGE